MLEVAYSTFDKIDPIALMHVLNDEKIRKHLIEHDLFSMRTIGAWMQAKMEEDKKTGCKVRGVVCNGELAGWCGIQCEAGRYELAIVLDRKFWGLGRSVFNDLMCWAKALGHDEVYIHFLDTRSEYNFLKKVSKAVYKEEMLGHAFTTYRLAVK